MWPFSSSCANHLIVVFSPETGTYYERPLHFITKGLQHLHKFPVHFLPATTTFACHLIDAEVWGDHFSHEQPCSDEKGSALNKPTALQFPIRFQLWADLGDNLVVNGCGWLCRCPFSEHHHNPQHHTLRQHTYDQSFASSSKQSSCHHNILQFSLSWIRKEILQNLFS